MVLDKEMPNNQPTASFLLYFEKEVRSPYYSALATTPRIQARRTS